jgi:hypothetical protein
LSNGAQVIAVRSQTTAVAPTKDSPAALACVADIGDVPPGTYAGSVSFELRATSPPRTWTLPLQIAVLDALIAQPVDFGSVEPGAICEGTLVIRNAGADVKSVDIVTEDIVAAGGLISLSAPAQLPLLRSKEQTAVGLKLAVSPLVSHRGPLESVLQLRRPSGVTSTVPVRLKVVDKGKGDCPLLVTPDHVRLSAVPGDVLKFDITIKLATGAASREPLTLQAARLLSTDGVATDSAPEFQWLGAAGVAAGKPATAQGFVVAPLRPGVYSTQVTVASIRTGTKVVPFTLHVRER